MNKTAIKNFAIWARNKLIADIQYRAGLMGITAEGIKPALPQSTAAMEFYDIGTPEPYAIAGDAIRQRGRLVEIIRQKEKDSDYPTAYKYILEEVAYTWFNRLIAIRFMEVNDYLPSHIRVLSSEVGKVEPDLVTTPFDAGLTFSPAEEETILRLKAENRLDELFRLLFIKQCNALNELLPALFEPTSDYTELLLNLSVVDREGVVYRLVHDIDEEDFNIEKGGQVEIIGWLYQYYNTEPKNAAFAKNGKITKEEIPAVTQLFTPDWIVRYMVENSLGRIFIDKRKNEGHYADGRGLDEMTWDDWESKRINTEEDIAEEMGWRYYLPEAAQTQEVRQQLDEIQQQNEYKNVQDIKITDPCMGSGHILVYAFDVLMQIYENQGWSQRDAAQSILEHNLYGLDIDDRAAQLAYFAVMMKARQYDRRILTRGITPHIHSIAESNAIGGAYKLAMGDFLLSKEHQETLNYLLEVFYDAKEYGSILQLESRDYTGLLEAWKLTASQTAENLNITLWYTAVEHEIPKFIEQAIILTQKYDVVVTNPPYMAVSNGNTALNKFVKDNYPDSKGDLFACFMERCEQFTKKDGYQAMITQHAWMFLSSFEKLRTKLLQSADIVNMAHLGPRAFEEIGGEVVQTTSFVLRRSHIQGYQGTYCRLIGPTTQQGKEEMFLAGENRYTAQQSNFFKIPGSPVAYWVSEAVLKCYENDTIGSIADVRHGLSTGKNEIFVRRWSEVENSKIDLSVTNQNERTHSKARYFPYNKGGEYRKWYGNADFVLWYDDEAQIKMNSLSGHRHDGRERYFQECITWSFISSSNFGVRYTPTGFVFDVAGSSMFANHSTLIYLTGVLCSKLGQFFMSIQNPTLNFQVGNLRNVPVIYFHQGIVQKIVEANIILSRADWDSYETSWDFKRHPLV